MGIAPLVLLIGPSSMMVFFKCLHAMPPCCKHLPDVCPRLYSQVNGRKASGMGMALASLLMGPSSPGSGRTMHGCNLQLNPACALLVGMG